jgi:hypothetical protein
MTECELRSWTVLEPCTAQVGQDSVDCLVGEDPAQHHCKHNVCADTVWNVLGHCNATVLRQLIFFAAPIKVHVGSSTNCT